MSPYINILNKWQSCIVQCIKHLLYINKQFNLEKINYEYNHFILILKSIKFSDINIFEYEHIFIFLKNKINILFNDNIIHYLKNQKSYSESINLDLNYVTINKLILNCNILYLKLQKKCIEDNIIISEKNTKFRNGVLSTIFYLNKSQKNISISQKYKILNIKKNDVHNDNTLSNIQLILFPIKPFINTYSNIDIYEEINHLSLKIPNSLFFTKYDINSLIDKKLLENSNIFSALNIKLITRLKTIENILYAKKTQKNKNAFDSSFTTKFSVKISNNFLLTPATQTHINDFKWYPFGGINLYAQKYIDASEKIILNNIKNNDSKLKSYFDTQSQQEIIKPILYNLELLFNTIFKEFKKQYHKMISMLEVDHIKFEYMHLFFLVIGKEYLNNGYIAKALKLIHVNECDKYILNSHIMNTHLDINKFKKELCINQTILLNTNGIDIWISLRNEFLKKNFENDFKLSKLERDKNILIQMKLIFTAVIEQKNKLECISNSIKLFGIIHAAV